MTAEPLWLYLALDVVLGPDRRSARSIAGREMFLPGELARGLAGADRRSSVLAAGRRTVRCSPRGRPPPRASAAVGGTRRSCVAGAASGWRIMVVLACGWGARVGVRRACPFGDRRSRLWGLAAGFIGCFLVYAWVFTDHVVAHRNQNILLCAPVGDRAPRSRRRCRDRAARARRARPSSWRPRRWAPCCRLRR